jgi:putative ABC transport system permease protein
MTSLAINVTIALRALSQNKLQALLTLCGMSVGVAMVVIVAGLGQGAQSTIEAQLESAGPTEITIRAGNFVPAGMITSGEQDSSGGEPGEGSESALDIPSTSKLRPNPGGTHGVRHRTPAPPLGDAELKLVRHDVKNVRAVAAGVEGNVRVAADEATRDDVAAASASVAVRVVRVHGIDATWPDIRGWKTSAGRSINADEYASAVALAVLTPAAARRLWPDATDPATAINRTLRLVTASDSTAGTTVAFAGASGGTSGAPDSPSSASSVAAGASTAAGGDVSHEHVVRVVGILRPSGDARESALVPSIYLPLGLAQTLLGRRTFDAITVQTASVGSTTSVAADIRGRLRQLRGLPADMLDDFRVETESISAMPTRGVDPRLARAVHANVVGFEQASYEEIARSLRQAGRTLTLLLIGAATVSLVVGGIGVMNIMLVSVASRTREIGLRMAMGARTADVLTQFLAEAVALASVGGAAGLVLGSIGLAVARHGLRWATTVSPGMLVLALAVAGLTGVAFGFGPARRAAALDPVVALRCE